MGADVSRLARERLEHTEEMLEVARRTANRETEFLAHNARAHCFLELCEGPGLMAAEIEAMVDLAELVHQPVYVWHTICLHVVRAALDGRFADAEQFAATLWSSGGFDTRATTRTSFSLRRCSRSGGRRGARPLWPAVEDHGERFPWIPRWREALAAAELGDVKAAHAELERHAP